MKDYQEGDYMLKQNNIKKKIKASGTTQPNIVMIPIDKIKQCRWGTGIRDKEKYEQLKESIKQRGMDDKPHVIPLKDGFFEPFIGDHRIMACREDGLKEIPCIVENISEQEAMERCVGNNTTHSDYDSVRLENLVNEMWNSDKYKSKAQLGDRIGLTGQRIGQLLKAKEIRDKSKVPFDERISTQCILDTSSLKDDDEKIALLKLVKENNIKPGDVKTYAETLSKVSEESRKKVLYDGQSLDSIKLINQSGLVRTNPNKTTGKSLIVNKNFLPEIYKNLNLLEDYFAFIKDDVEKKEAIKYIKFYTGLFLRILTNEGVIHEDVFNDFLKNYLKIDKSLIHHFDGKNTKGADWYLEEKPSTDEEEVK